MLEVGQILRNKNTEEIGFFQGFINAEFDVGIILPEVTTVVHGYNGLKETGWETIEEGGKIKLGKFVEEDLDGGGNYFGFLNKKSVHKIQKNWKYYAEQE